MLIALCAGVIFYKLGVPGGMMVGAIVGAALFNIFTGMAVMPPWSKLTAQCLAGSFIACTVERDDLIRLPCIFYPALVLLGGVLTLNLILGVLIWLVSPMDLLTSLMCAVPGGMSDTPMIAADLGADAPKVAVMQFIRMSAGVGIFPSLIAAIVRHETAETHSGSASRPRQKGTFRYILLTLSVALACGWLGKWAGIPAGPLVFSMLGVIALKLAGIKVFLPLKVKRLAQALSGAYIGCGISQADVLEMRNLLLPAVLLLTGYLLNSIVTGQILHRLFKLPLRVSMLAATPAGASDMALISADLGVNSKELVELQIIRMVVVVSVFPQIIWLISKFFG